MSPAACQVVPAVSWRRSSNTVSFQPSLARWYAMAAPITPPPMITTRAWSGNGAFAWSIASTPRLAHSAAVGRP